MLIKIQDVWGYVRDHCERKKNLHPNAYLEVYNDNQMFVNVHVILFIIKWSD